MARTEATRREIKSNYVLPPDVQTKLEDWNKYHPIKLNIIFEEETNCWQIYKIKHTAINADDDILCWQMAAPTTGTAISTGIFDWLRRYDQSNGGLLDRDELKNKWLKQWKSMQFKQKEDKAKRVEAAMGGARQVLGDLFTSTFTVPITVGYDTKKKKKILAVPVGTSKRMKEQERRVMSG